MDSRAANCTEKPLLLGAIRFIGKADEAGIDRATASVETKAFKQNPYDDVWKIQECGGYALVIFSL